MEWVVYAAQLFFSKLKFIFGLKKSKFEPFMLENFLFNILNIFCDDLDQSSPKKFFLLSNLFKYKIA
jgi:hypothetical protein